MVTGDKKWVTYNNVKRKQSWSNPGVPEQTVAKPGLTVRKGIIYYELLPYCQTLKSDLYCQQLDQLKETIAQKQPALVNRRGIVFYQDNARPHTSLVTRHKLWELGWEPLMHPPYIPDLAPSDYYLFLSMANDFTGEKFASREACENRLSIFCQLEREFL
ncbi:Putative DD34D transposase [Caligus rogercresseyi]|uniref:DD34D transposase n=1 Tax=Caligus rogercresseyi TaxID=217165 RepID=A0A7T8K9R4_CALRO|nr:Putative DD34D transposase [Caligus rogercresseyi]